MRLFKEGNTIKDLEKAKSKTEDFKKNLEAELASKQAEQTALTGKIQDAYEEGNRPVALEKQKIELAVEIDSLKQGINSVSKNITEIDENIKKAKEATRVEAERKVLEQALANVPEAIKRYVKNKVALNASEREIKNNNDTVSRIIRDCGNDLVKNGPVRWGPKHNDGTPISKMQDSYSVLTDEPAFIRWELLEELVREEERKNQK